MLQCEPFNVGTRNLSACLSGMRCAAMIAQEPDHERGRHNLNGEQVEEEPTVVFLLLAGGYILAVAYENGIII